MGGRHCLVRALDGRTPKVIRRGTHRGVAPQATVERILSLASQIGITRVADVTGLDHLGIPVIVVVRPNSRGLAVAQGKGLDLWAAKASGLMESVETWTAEQIVRPVQWGRRAEVAEIAPVVDVDALAKVRGGGYDERLSTLWIEADELLGGSPVWVPYELVHTDFRLPLPPGGGCFPVSSNGLASGNTLVEALSHALAEVIERDAHALWSQQPAARAATRIDLETVDDPDCRSLIDRLHAAGAGLAVWDLTSDVRVAACRAMIIDMQSDPIRPMPAFRGTGCHTDRTVAFLRAVTEAVQSRLTYISGSRDDLTRTAYASAWDERQARQDRSMVTTESGSRNFSAVPTFAGDTLEADTNYLLGRLRDIGISQVAAVDLTHPVIDVPVVRVVVPGLESLHTMPTYTPGPRALRIHEEPEPPRKA